MLLPSVSAGADLLVDGWSAQSTNVCRTKVGHCHRLAVRFTVRIDASLCPQTIDRLNRQIQAVM